MTGTAKTEEVEFEKTYKLDPIRRRDSGASIVFRRSSREVRESRLRWDRDTWGAWLPDLPVPRDPDQPQG